MSGIDKNRLEKARRQTLSAIPSLVGQLVYLSSLRDFNTGRYYHAGWAAASSEEEANATLRDTHGTVFERIVGLSLEQLARELEGFFLSASSETDLSTAVSTWRESRAYQILPPLRCYAIDRELFDSSLKAALAVLAHRRPSSPPVAPAA